MLKKIRVLTIFPKFFDQFSEYGVVGKAIKSKKIDFSTFDIRSHGIGNNNRFCSSDTDNRCVRSRKSQRGRDNFGHDGDSFCHIEPKPESELAEAYRTFGGLFQ